MSKKRALVAQTVPKQETTAHQRKLMVLEQQLAQALPPKIGEQWQSARASKVAIQRPDSAPAGAQSPKPCLPGASWATSTAVMRLWSLHTFLEGAKRARFAYADDLDFLLQPDTTALILNHLMMFELTTRARIITDLRIMAQRLIYRDPSWLAVGARRLRSQAPRKVDDGRQRSRPEYLAAALKMRPASQNGIRYEPEAAVRLRQAAIVGMMADISPRLSEAAELLLAQVIIDREKVTILIASEDSKSRFGQVRQLLPEMATLMRDYVLHARPVLANLPTADGSNNLWLSNKGRSMTHSGAVGALHGPLEKVLGATASANVFRDAQIDRDDVRDSEKPAAIGHRGGSWTSDKNYGSRRYADAVAAVQALLAEEDAEFARHANENKA